MTKFVRIKGDLVNVDQIASARRTKAGVTVWLVDGSTLTAEEYPEGLMQQIQYVGSTVIPAPPGYLVLHTGLSSLDELEIWTEPVIAFRCRPNSGVLEAVTLETCGDEWTLLAPNGEVTRAYMESWDNMEDFKRDELKRLLSGRRRTG